MWIEYELAMDHQRDLRDEAARDSAAAAVLAPRRPLASRPRTSRMRALSRRRAEVTCLRAASGVRTAS